MRAAGSPNDLFFILLNDQSDGITGRFNGQEEGSLTSGGNGQIFKLTYFANSDSLTFIGGNDVVPEPGTAFSLLNGLCLLLGLRRHRKSPLRTPVT